MTLLGIAAAMAAGHKFYTTGRPCKRGHPSKRYVSSGCCKACLEITNAKPETMAKNRQREADRRLADVEAAKRRERIACRAYSKRHPKRVLAATRAYQCAKAQRTPAWANLPAIRAFYESCPQGMEVDHILPLRGKLVCGLHVLDNLQYLTVADNRAKGNR